MDRHRSKTFGRFEQLVDRGLRLTRLCALYFSRSLVEALAGTPFHDELEGVDQLELTIGLEVHNRPAAVLLEGQVLGWALGVGRLRGREQVRPRRRGPP